MNDRAMPDLVPLEPEGWAHAAWPLGAHPADSPPLTAADVLADAEPDSGTWIDCPDDADPEAEDPEADDPEAVDADTDAGGGSAGVTFAVFAPRASRVLLEFYAEAVGVDAFAEFDCVRGDDGAWRAHIDGVGHGALYGYRCWGPNWPFDERWSRGDSDVGFIGDFDSEGDRFNPNKVLFDPYTREITHNPASPEVVEAGGEEGVFATGAVLLRGRPRREIDSGRWAPKGVYLHDETYCGERPHLPPEDTIVYEAHVRGLTAHPSSVKLHELVGTVPGFEAVANVPDELRGTYAGAGYMAPYLKALGVTVIELLPVHQSISSGRPLGPDDPPENYWGYATLAYFAPHRDYAHDRSPGGPTREFKQMVAAFHEAGIEVYLDVVYNHSGEGGHWLGDLDTTAFTSLGGFAAEEYYALSSECRLIDGATGVSNQLNFSNEITCRLTLDSLCYWANDMGVDGFRFDLAPVLGRKPDAAHRDDWERQREFFGQHPLLLDIARLADLSHVEVVAEAWDLWGYEVGNFPSGWAEWNGRYRDAIRGFAKGDANTRAFVDQVNADYAHFHDQGGPSKSINFVTAHDGFTLMDLVSYNEPTNTSLTWPFGPSDGGTDSNASWDSGGDHALRRARMRSMLAILLFSRGVPMIVSGDEYGRGQNGNNNPYAINTAAIWNNWAQAGTNAPMRVAVDPQNPDSSGMYYDVFGEADTPEDLNPMLVFTRALMQQRHASPALRQRSWGSTHIGGPDVSYLYFDASGCRPVRDGERAVQVLIDSGEADPGDFLILVNMQDHPVTFGLRGPHENCVWGRLLDTAPYAEAQCNVFGSLAYLADLDHGDAPDVLHGDTYDVHPWSVVVLHEIV